jgi:hypothetical protein
VQQTDRAGNGPEVRGTEVTAATGRVDIKQNGPDSVRVTGGRHRPVILIDQESHVRMTHYGYDASEHMGSVISQQIEQLLGGPSGGSRSTP